jgi:replication factor C subunit 3/5
MFLIDKYRPSSQHNAYFHNDIYNILTKISEDNGMPHIILYGPEGSGKKTLVKIFLEMLFDEDVHKVKEVPYKVVGSGNKITIEKIKQSNYHIVIDPKNTNYDRYLIHDIVKEYAKRKSLGVFKTKKQFRVILINNIDNMSYYALTALRRTMERYNDKCRFIMWCNSLSKIIKPLQSRCICLGIPSPLPQDMFSYLFKISVKENIKLSFEKYLEIVENSKGNIKTALWNLEFLKTGYNFNTNYNIIINNIIIAIFNYDLNDILKIRNMIFSLTITNCEGIDILRDLIDMICLNDSIDDMLKYDIINMGSQAGYGIINGRREIIHLDTFVITAMKLIRNYKLKI